MTKKCYVPTCKHDARFKLDNDKCACVDHLGFLMARTLSYRVSSAITLLEYGCPDAALEVLRKPNEATPMINRKND